MEMTRRGDAERWRSSTTSASNPLPASDPQDSPDRSGWQKPSSGKKKNEKKSRHFDIALTGMQSGEQGREMKSSTDEDSIFRRGSEPPVEKVRKQAAVEQSGGPSVHPERWRPVIAPAAFTESLKQSSEIIKEDRKKRVTRDISSSSSSSSDDSDEPDDAKEDESNDKYESGKRRKNDLPIKYSQGTDTKKMGNEEVSRKPRGENSSDVKNRLMFDDEEMAERQVAREDKRHTPEHSATNTPRMPSSPRALRESVPSPSSLMQIDSGAGGVEKPEAGRTKTNAELKKQLLEKRGQRLRDPESSGDGFSQASSPAVSNQEDEPSATQTPVSSFVRF